MFAPRFSVNLRCFKVNAFIAQKFHFNLDNDVKKLKIHYIYNKLLMVAAILFQLRQSIL